MHCVWSEWENWDTNSCRCPNHPKSGIKSRLRHVEVRNLYGGEPCRDKDGNAFPDGRFLITCKM